MSLDDKLKQLGTTVRTRQELENLDLIRIYESDGVEMYTYGRDVIVFNQISQYGLQLNKAYLDYEEVKEE